ncbi:DNA glycosylase AlkZ-like family protein [Lacisediminihabitans sp. FW035]
MAVITVTKQDARRIAVRAALLDSRQPKVHPPDDVVGVVRELAILRVELTSTVAPAADHICWSRLGSSYRPVDTERALSQGLLFERGWMLRPMSDLGLYLAGMRTWADRTGAAGWMQDNADFARSILDRIADEGPKTSRDIPDEAVAPWPSTGWTNNRNVTQMLECLHMAGELAVVGRAGRLRIWDLAERVFAPVAEIPAEEARRIRSERLLGACGIMRDSIAVSPTELHGIAAVGEAATIEGVAGKWRVDPAQLGRPFEGRTVLLSPFDRLMTDPHRVARLFEFDYSLEIYKPARSRIWGQFALPILHGDRLVGKVDARSDRDSGRFIVHRIHEDEPFDRSTKAAVDAQVESFAEWLRLTVVRG